MSPSPSIQIQAITHLLAPTSSTSITCLHHLACVKTPPRQTHCFRNSRGFFWRETRRSLGNSSWQSISLRVVAPSLPPVDWSPCCYLPVPCTGRKSHTHSRAPPAPKLPDLASRTATISLLQSFTRADFPHRDSSLSLTFEFFGFRPKLRHSWCKAQLISLGH